MALSEISNRNTSLKITLWTSPLPDRGDLFSDLFRAILYKWRKIVGWGIRRNQHIQMKMLAKNLLSRSQKHLRAWKQHLWSHRESVFQQLFLLSSGKLDCTGPLRNQKGKQNHLSVRGDDLFTSMSPNKQWETHVEHPWEDAGFHLTFIFSKRQLSSLRKELLSLLPPLLSVKKTTVSTFLHQRAKQTGGVIYRGLPARSALCSTQQHASSLPAGAKNTTHSCTVPQTAAHLWEGCDRGAPHWRTELREITGYRGKHGTGNPPCVNGDKNDSSLALRENAFVFSLFSTKGKARVWVPQICLTYFCCLGIG